MQGLETAPRTTIFYYTAGYMAQHACMQIVARAVVCIYMQPDNRGFPDKNFVSTTVPCSGNFQIKSQPFFRSFQFNMYIGEKRKQIGFICIKSHEVSSNPLKYFRVLFFLSDSELFSAYQPRPEVLSFQFLRIRIVWQNFVCKFSSIGKILCLLDFGQYTVAKLSSH